MCFYFGILLYAPRGGDTPGLVFDTIWEIFKDNYVELCTTKTFSLVYGIQLILKGKQLNQST